MPLPTIDYNRDVVYGTLAHFIRKDPPLNFAYQTYDFFNKAFGAGIYKVGGRKLKGNFATGTVGNAGFSNVWAEDTTVIKNITQEYELDNIKYCKGSMAFNQIEMDANRTAEAAEQIFDVVKLQYNKAKLEVIEKIYLASWTGLAGATDVDSMYSVFDWIACGTNNSAGTYSGYSARYNDASNTGGSLGTAFNKAGVSSSSTSNPEFGSYYIDHNGLLDESLYLSINRANIEQNFRPPTMLGMQGVPVMTYAAYTNLNMILTLNALNAKLNANVGPQPNQAGYYPTTGPVLPGGVPVVYVDILNTQRDSIYGTDPIVGINHNVLYPVVLQGWFFKITEANATNRHLVRTMFIDSVLQWWCERPPKWSGWLISKHPGSGD